MLRVLIVFIFAILLIFNSIAQNTRVDSIKTGEQIFKGQVVILDSLKACSSCHWLVEPDTFNWNPSAYEIAETFMEQSMEKWEEVMSYSLSEKMFESHEGYFFSISDYAYINSYLKHLQQETQIEKNEISWRMFFLIVFGVLLFLIGIDRIFFRFINHSLTYNFLFILFVIGMILTAKDFIYGLGLQKEYEPDQPVKFSHKTHCEQNETNCTYCHSGVKRGKEAGFPSINICMNCHTMVREGSKSGEFEIKKVLAANVNRQPIHWVRLNNLPSHVQFDHSLHYVSGNIECVECHGEVEKMDRIKNMIAFSMKWCLDCHADKQVDFNSHFLYSNNQMTDSLTVKETGGWDCMNCHH